MSAWKLPFTILLMVASGTVYKTFAARIPKEIREKRSQVMHCDEKVLSSNPCEKVICPQGHNGRPEMLFYECPGIPKLCPMSIKNNSATCCPEKCVCSNGEEMFRPGDKFMAEKDGQDLECKCGMDKVPDCQEVIIVPSKEPPRPPPVFPPPGMFPPQRDTE